MNQQRNGYHRLDNARNPDDPSGERIQLWMSIEMVHNSQRYSNFRFENIKTAAACIVDPLRINAHIRDGDESQGWCYVSAPDQIRSGQGDGLMQNGDRLFTVFVDSEFRVFDWGRENRDIVDRDSPDGASEQALAEGRGRFGELVWIKTT
ncbi:MAG: hypothetical protein V3W41_20530 [Planctomycetota bacterium]